MLQMKMPIDLDIPDVTKDLPVHWALDMLRTRLQVANETLNIAPWDGDVRPADLNKASEVSKGLKKFSHHLETEDDIVGALTEMKELGFITFDKELLVGVVKEHVAGEIQQEVDRKKLQAKHAQASAKRKQALS
jgi:hypothetical protein